MAGSFIVVDANTLQLVVRSDIQVQFIPTEQTVEISKQAKFVKDQLSQFLKEKHDPAVAELLRMVEEFNLVHSPEYAAKKKAELQALEESQESAKVKQEEEETVKKKSSWFRKKKKKT